MCSATEGELYSVQEEEDEKLFFFFLNKQASITLYLHLLSLSNNKKIRLVEVLEEFR